jgi:5S rRNA maturation endonuclease (ribonuclease M5)
MENNTASQTKVDTTALKRHVGITPYRKRVSDLREITRTEWRGSVPWRFDGHPSLSVYWKNGEWFWIDQSVPASTSRSQGDVIAFIRLTDGDAKTFFRAVHKLQKESAYKGSLGDMTDFADEPQKATSIKKFDFAAAQKRLGEAQTLLEGRGVSMTVAQKFGLGVTDIPTAEGSRKALVIPYGATGAAKIRLLEPTDSDKWRQIAGAPTHRMLYAADHHDPIFTDTIYVTESELDALMLISLDLDAVSVSSAVSCIDREGRLKIDQEYLDLISGASHIYLMLDMDEAGQRCASAFEKTLTGQALRITWPYQKGKAGLAGAKDVGELYSADPATFAERLKGLVTDAIHRPPAWRLLFKSPSQMEAKGGVEFLIDDFLPAGVTFIGALPGGGKTWLALSIMKALTTGRNFLGVFPVREKIPVIYMTPETGEVAFKARIEKMRIPEEGAFIRTLKDGAPLDLTSPDLLEAVRSLKPVIVLDTGIRFSKADSENEARANAKDLGVGILGLVAAGARAVIVLHHSTKASKGRRLTLENALRGTGDFGALCDAAYGLAVKDEENFIVEVVCLKPRDFEPVPPFNVQGRPYINEIGDFGMLSDRPRPQGLAELDRLGAAIQGNPKITYRELVNQTGINHRFIESRAASIGWRKEGSLWVQQQPPKP